ncbi:hypothetical protein METH_20980 [Leisingera methylohalidivorans DSM 14336]|uniref:Uncharacterized protein n=2 Tax=Leisingera methylohalidivorans TaxID=133924 RepID=V9W0Z8_9RHOB|nr:hypothetical protein METH_20980 [Leisingera methylohalidivorans DSM 14336]
MRRLVINGHTPATKMKTPRTNAELFSSTSENIDAFHRKSLTPRTLAKDLGRSWKGVSAEVRARAIEPFSPDGADFGNLYLREKVLSPKS